MDSVLQVYLCVKKLSMRLTHKAMTVSSEVPPQLSYYRTCDYWYILLSLNNFLQYDYYFSFKVITVPTELTCPFHVQQEHGPLLLGIQTLLTASHAFQDISVLTLELRIPLLEEQIIVERTFVTKATTAN